MDDEKVVEVVPHFAPGKNIDGDEVATDTKDAHNNSKITNNQEEDHNPFITVVQFYWIRARIAVIYFL